MVVLVPSVSIGNVPQLAVDLLLSTYDEFELVKCLDDEYLSPFAGPRDFTEGPQPKGVATAAQLYRKGDIYIVQLRSPVLPFQKHNFAEQLKKELPSDDVLIVSSANAGARIQQGLPLLTISKPNEPLQDSGFTQEALECFKCETVVLYTYEGDNIEDARQLAQVLVGKLGLEPRQFKTPVSWRHIYGKDVPLGLEQGIYT